MRFAAPQWFWALWLVPLFIAVLFWNVRRRKARMKRFADPSIWERIAPEMDWNASLKKGIIAALAFGFAVFALARPQWGKQEEVVKLSGLDVMMVLDVSNSMEVEDVVPSRLKKAKHVIRSLLERLDGDRVGIVAFAESSYLASPLTTDLGYIDETLDVLTPKSVLNQGTDIGTAIDTAVRALDRAAEEEKHEGAQDSGKSRVVLLLSDGEDHEDQLQKAAKELRASGAQFYVLGVGTEKGGPIPVRDDSGQLFGYKRDRKGQPIVSAFHPDSLKKLAADAGGQYWTITPGEGEANTILADIGALNRTEFAERRVVSYNEHFQIPLALAIALLFLEASLPARKILMILLGLGLAGFSPRAAVASDSAPLGVYLENREGLKAFKDGKIEDAEKSFSDAQAKDPNRPELRFNQGAVQFEKGDLDGAIESFQAASKAARSREKPGLAAKSQFNLGSALSKKGDFKGALSSYLDAIDSARAAKDPTLEAEARKNVQLLREQQKKQQQQQKQAQQKQQQQQNQKDQQQQKQAQSQGEQQKKDQQEQAKQNPQQKYQQGGKRQFKSEKLSKEDADRVMSELSSREKELQSRLKKQRGQPMNSDKDW
jgi:Ca-activated chloride channel family protein